MPGAGNRSAPGGGCTGGCSRRIVGQTWSGSSEREARLARSRGLAPPSIGLVWVERVRAGLREAVRHRAAEPRALVPALVLGDTSAITPALEADFRTTGLTHLTAVSGANLTVLLGFMLIMARWAGVRGWWLRIVGLVGVLAFVALCRSEPSVLRAAAMGLVVLAALGIGGRRSGLRHLALAVMLLVLIDPYLSRSLGFALSVLASAGIIIWSRPWTQTLNRWLPLVVAESVAVPLAAQLSTLPLIAAISGRVSVVGLLANAVAGPLVAPATVLGFAAAGLSLVSALLAAVAGFGAAWSAQMIIWVARLAAALPGASWQWPASPVALGLLAGLTVLGGMLTGYALARRRHRARPGCGPDRLPGRGPYPAWVAAARVGTRRLRCRPGRRTCAQPRRPSGRRRRRRSGSRQDAALPRSARGVGGAVADLDPLPRRPRRRPGRSLRPSPGGRDLDQPAGLT